MNTWVLLAAGGIVTVCAAWIVVEAIRAPIMEDVPHVAPDVAQFNYGWESEYLRDWEDYEVAALDAAYGEFVDDRTPLVLKCLASRETA
jgi:uncharacterized membrane protein